MARPTPRHLCPRCGYDVSGVVPTWADSCPLQGRCSECGLVYEWVDIFRPERVFPRWSFEHARKKRYRTLARTLLKALLPGRLWSQMRLAAPVQVFRLVLLILLVLTLTHLTAVGIATRVSWDGLWQSTLLPTGPRGRLMITFFFDWDHFETIALFPYRVMWLRLIGPLGLLLIIWGILAPMPFLVLQQTMAACRVRRVHLFRGWAYFLVFVGLFAIGDMVIMTGSHLFFGGAMSVPLQETWMVLGVVLLLLASVWMVRWWWLFTDHYLQIPRSKRVTACMLIISFLGSLIICLSVDRDLGQPIGETLNRLLDWRTNH